MEKEEKIEETGEIGLNLQQKKVEQVVTTVNKARS